MKFVLFVFCFILFLPCLIYTQEKFQDVSPEVKQAIKEFQKRGIFYNFINKFDLRFNPAEPINRERFILALSEYDIQIRKLIERVSQVEKKITQFSEGVNNYNILQDSLTVIVDSTSIITNISDLSKDSSKLKSDCKIMNQVIRNNFVYPTNNIRMEEMLIIDNHLHELFDNLDKKIKDLENNFKSISNFLLELNKNYNDIKERDIMKLSNEIININNEIRQHKILEEERQKKPVNTK